MTELVPFLCLRQTLAAMQAAANEEDWDRFLRLQEEYQSVAPPLPPLNRVRVPTNQRSQFIALLQDIHAGLNTILPLAQTQRHFLSGELAGLRNSAKLNNAYLGGRLG
ncbi:flagellar protein FliT [Propionivibrio limicola]|uniref:flagellar protein FliT n=1 Tax=Propionivibrio limicola TaxID=167645 RepID=UPI001479736F|nr:flagellar protein FliT [Propionivibrio limicola]